MTGTRRLKQEEWERVNPVKLPLQFQHRNSKKYSHMKYETKEKEKMTRDPSEFKKFQGTKVSRVDNHRHQLFWIHQCGVETPMISQLLHH